MLDALIVSEHPSPVEQTYLALEKQGDQSDLARALRAWRSGPRDWRLLYHVYEIIKHDVSPDRDDYKALQAVTPPGMTWPELNAELERFRKTANDPRPRGIGGAARSAGAKPDQ